MRPLLSLQVAILKAKRKKSKLDVVVRNLHYYITRISHLKLQEEIRDLRLSMEKLSELVEDKILEVKNLLMNDAELRLLKQITL